MSLFVAGTGPKTLTWLRSTTTFIKQRKLRTKQTMTWKQPAVVLTWSKTQYKMYEMKRLKKHTKWSLDTIFLQTYLVCHVLGHGQTGRHRDKVDESSTWRPAGADRSPEEQDGAEQKNGPRGQRVGRRCFETLQWLGTSEFQVTSKQHQLQDSTAPTTQSSKFTRSRIFKFSAPLVWL